MASERAPHPFLITIDGSARFRLGQPSIHPKAAALLHCIGGNHPLVDGNKRFALAATFAFYGLNGFRLTMSDDEP